MALKITRIKMSSGGTNVEHISELKVQFSSERSEWYSRLHMYNNVEAGHKYEVNISPYPELISSISSNGTKYVKSKPDSTGKDNLLNLPRD